MNDKQENDDIYNEFVSLGIFTMIETGIISGAIENEREGVYWLRQLIKRYEEDEQFEKCQVLHEKVTAYAKLMKINLEEDLDE
jgi:hypothetical protein